MPLLDRLRKPLNGLNPLDPKGEKPDDPNGDDELLELPRELS